MKQVASSAQEIRPLVAQDAAEPSTAVGASSVPVSTKEVSSSSGSQAGKRSILDDVDDDPEIRKLDEAFQYRPSSFSLKSKGATPDPEPKPLARKRKNETLQTRSSDPLPMPNSEGAKLLAKNIHKGPEMTVVVAAVNNAMSAVGVNSGLHSGYVHALKKKTPYADVPLLNRNAEELNAVVACFDSLIFPVVEDLPKLVNEPLSEIKKALFFASGGSPKE
ncbi:hypothetical protein Hdeb2414_s0022g00614931 [Helianthus debilis subsp. tardiflorus]